MSVFVCVVCVCVCVCACVCVACIDIAITGAAKLSTSIAVLLRDRTHQRLNLFRETIVQILPLLIRRAARRGRRVKVLRDGKQFPLPAFPRFRVSSALGVLICASAQRVALLSLASDWGWC